MFKYFNKDEVLNALEDVGYYIHTRTINEARSEADELCEHLSEHLNELSGFESDEDDENRIFIFNLEVPPSCNFGVIRRSDRFNFDQLRQHEDKQLLIDEIESTRIGQL